MIHSSYYRPRYYPYNSGASAEIDRLQNLSATLTINRDKIKEIGRDGMIDWRLKIPSLRVSATQLEYGGLEFWRKLANKADSVVTLSLNDFKTAMGDIAGYKTDDAGTFLGTIWYPKLRLSSFNINIGDPQAIIERSFEFAGEDEIILLNNNKYLIQRSFSVGTGSNTAITISDGSTYPHPVLDPDNSASYLLRVVRERAGVTTDLVYTTDYTYNNSTHIATIVTTTAGDIIKVFWSATTAGTQTFFTNNDTDAAALLADQASIYLESANYVYKLQTVSIAVNFDRTDYYEIGSNTVIQRGVRNKTVTVTLGRILEAYTIEEILRNVNGASWGKIDTRKFNDNFALVVKLYNSNAKTSFLMKYHITNLAPTSMEDGVTLDDYVTRNATLESEDMIISTVE